MQFYADGEVFKVVRITGPTHNLLGLEFGEKRRDDVAIESLSLDEKQRTTLDAENVKWAVIRGVEIANREFSTNYQLKRIQFVETDSPPADIYTELARQIIKRLVTNPVEYNGADG